MKEIKQENNYDKEKIDDQKSSNEKNEKEEENDE